MKGLRLAQWVVQRGVISGAIEGALLGTVLYPIVGTIYGLFIGAILGLVLGLLNGISLAFTTRVLLNPPYNRPVYILFVLLLAIPIDIGIILASLGQALGIPTALIASLSAAYFSFRFVRFADAQGIAIASGQQVTQGRLKYKIIILSLIVLCLAIASDYAIMRSFHENQRIPDRYLIPAGYIGEVKVYYHVAGTPPLPLEDGHYLLVIPSDGVLKTASNIEYGVASDDDYYSYQLDGKRKPLLDTEWGGGGMIWADATGGDSSGSTYATFFVGTEAQYDQQFEVTPARQPTANMLSPK